MPVYNLNPGAIKHVAAGEIPGTVQVYRTQQGYPNPGTVGWVPNGGGLQQRDIAVGETVSFQINGAAGMIASGAPSMLQLLWSSGRQAAGTQAEAVHLLRPAAVDGDGGHEAGVLGTAALATTSASGDAPAQQAMADLTAQWYNTVTAQCGLDPATFQLVQGAAPIGSTSEGLWNIFDAVPPLSVSNYFNPSQLNSFSSNYGSIIANLKPQNAQRFVSDMGDYYSQWAAYLKTGPTIPAGGMVQLFSNWANLNLPDPGMVQQCITDFQQVSQGTVPVAITMWLNSGGATGAKAYNATIQALTSKLLSAPSKSVEMNSKTASSDVSHTWAEGSVEGAYDFFAGEASASYSSLTTALASAGITISATFQRLLQFPAAPLSKPSSDPILSQYQPWFSSPALNLAYQNNNNVVWNNTPPTWQDSFGPNGNMLRTCSALVVVDGIDITMTSNVAFSSSQQQDFQAAAKAGFWPFFSASASGGWSNDTSFDSSGNVTVKSSSPLGNPTILGVTVTPIGGALLLD